MTKLSKRMQENCKLLKNEKEIFEIAEAVDFLKNNSKVKFDESIEIALNLKLDVRKSEQNLRGVTILPHGTGKKITVAVFAEEKNAKEATKAGADKVGNDDLIEEIQKGIIAFDKYIATPDMMPKIGKIAKILGPKGLMPNPKLGTVTNNVAKAIADVKAGQVEYRTEKNGIVHAGLGKLSFSKEKLIDNIKSFLQIIVKMKPNTVKGRYIGGVFLSSTMGPSLKIKISDLH